MSNDIDKILEKYNILTDQIFNFTPYVNVLLQEIEFLGANLKIYKELDKIHKESSEKITNVIKKMEKTLEKIQKELRSASKKFNLNFDLKK
ncbi:MAG: hypothetical protein QXX38_00630 [Candidatus Aenigmatarchaeota archaeon]